MRTEVNRYKPGRDPGKTVLEMYVDLLHELEATLSLKDHVPHRFFDTDFREQYEKKLDRLDTMIALYSDLIRALRCRN